MTTVIAQPRDLLGKEGLDLGTTDWLTIDQPRIDLFADATGDHQWIHVDPVRAKDGPFGATIAHGYLTLALVNIFLPQLIEVRRFAAGINIGADGLRFLSPVRAGSRVRGHYTLKNFESQPGARWTATWDVTVEIEGESKPAIAAEWINAGFF